MSPTRAPSRPRPGSRPVSEPAAQWLASAATRWGEQRAVTVDGVHHSFRATAERAGRYAWMLAAAGVRAGDNVLLQLPNGVELIGLAHAAWQLWAVPVPVVALYRQRELVS